MATFEFLAHHSAPDIPRGRSGEVSPRCVRGGQSASFSHEEGPRQEQANGRFKERKCHACRIADVSIITQELLRAL